MTRFRLLLSPIIIRLGYYSFLLNFLWENLHAPLYWPYISFRQFLPFSLVATLGDILVTVISYLLVSQHKISRWRKALILCLIGIALAIIIEKSALALDIWGYRPEMPLVPVLHIGLTPMLQLPILIPLAYLLAVTTSQKEIRDSEIDK